MRRRRWEDRISREEALHLLGEGQLLDLLTRLEEARAHHPHDLELLRSVRVLRHHLGPALRRAS